MRDRKEIEVARDPAEAFAYLADYSHAADWSNGCATTPSPDEAEARPRVTA
jgi:hypothetical protein